MLALLLDSPGLQQRLRHLHSPLTATVQTHMTCDTLHACRTDVRTLENAIRTVEAHPDWRARVVYGDTDSMFVLLPGRSRARRTPHRGLR